MPNPQRQQAERSTEGINYVKLRDALVIKTLNKELIGNVYSCAESVESVISCININNVECSEATGRPFPSIEFISTNG